MRSPLNIKGSVSKYFCDKNSTKFQLLQQHIRINKLFEINDNRKMWEPPWNNNHTAGVPVTITDNVFFDD